MHPVDDAGNVIVVTRSATLERMRIMIGVEMEMELEMEMDMGHGRR